VEMAGREFAAAPVCSVARIQLEHSAYPTEYWIKVTFRWSRCGLCTNLAHFRLALSFSSESKTASRIVSVQDVLCVIEYTL
jgi:hypothetical protein